MTSNESASNSIYLSFCTVSKNRLHHIKNTLPLNIHNNRDQSNIEFVLLDYNSSDGIESWIQSELKHFVELGLLRFYRTNEPEFFNRSHSRNMAFRLAQGEILCNLDADNFTGIGFANYLKQKFKINKNRFLCTENQKNRNSNILGRICCFRNDFFLTGGFDERMKEYGYEDLDFISRLQMAGKKKYLISDLKYMHSIAHSGEERIKEEFPLRNLKNLYVSYVSPSSSLLLFIFKNETFALGTLVCNRSLYADNMKMALHYRKPSYEFSIMEKNWIRGIVRKSGVGLMLQSDTIEYILKDQSLSVKQLVYDSNQLNLYNISNPKMIEEAILFLSEIGNRNLMLDNRIERKIKINGASFGKGIIFKNFDHEHPIILP